MKIENLEAFVKIAQLKSFTLAADACFCTQATMSQRLKNLENYFKVQLFDRVGRTIELTEEGKRVLPFCQSALNAIQQSKVELEAMNGLSTGELILCSSNTPGTYLLPQILADYHLQYPGISIDSRIKYARDVMQEISFDGEAELGFVSQPEIVEDKKITYQPILKDQLQVIVSPQHPMIEKWSKEKQISIKDLQKQNLLVSNGKTSLLANLEKACGEKISFESLIVLGSMEAVKKAVMLNTGVAIVSKFLIEDELENQRLYSFDLDRLNLSRTVYLLHRKNCSLSPAANAFIETLRTDISDKYPKLVIEEL